MSYLFVPQHLAVKSLRDNGYKNAAFALAELMDNAVQANARHVELLCGQQDVDLAHNRVPRIRQIAVLDDGGGMDAETLRIALQVGNGTHLTPAQQTGIGKFGMGLPLSSISQCKRVDVWSWQNGPESALHTYLDVDKISSEQEVEVPVPQLDPVPKPWTIVGNSFTKTGTLVVWSNLDRCQWKTASAIINNSEYVIGRMYRRFLSEGKLDIRLVSFELDAPLSSTERYARPNDPGYLIANTSCPAPFNATQMFQIWGEENSPRVFTIKYKGVDHEVQVRFSHVKPEARDSLKKGVNPGSLPHGKHAGGNVGVSIVRAGRELDLDAGWTINYDPVERWWGVEIEFPPALDELFGVTNNKQAANYFSALAQSDLDELLKDKTIHQLKAEMVAENDPRGPLLDIALAIRENIRLMREWLRTQAAGSRSKTRHDPPIPEQQGTAATKDRQAAGHKGKSDSGENLPPPTKKEEIASDLVAQGATPQEAEEKAASTVDAGLKYIFTKNDLSNPAFFSIKQRGGVIMITLNTTHPAYDKLIEVLDQDVEDASIEDLKQRLHKSRDGLKLLLEAWARYEDEQPDGTPREMTQKTRTDWGYVAQQFFKKGD